MRAAGAFRPFRPEALHRARKGLYWPTDTGGATDATDVADVP